jgi:hypothetical protein
MLREYVYLDRNRVEDFLAQLEGGVLDTMRKAEASTGAGVEAGLNVGVGRLGAKVSAPSISQEDLRRTTDVALFERLYRHFEMMNLKRASDTTDIKWGDVCRGSFLELECRAVLSAFTKMAKLLDDLAMVASLMGESLDEVNGFGALFGDEIDVRYLLGDEIVAYSSLHRESLRTILTDLEGECTALVRVRKTVKHGKRLPVQAVAGMKPSTSTLETLLEKLGNPPKEMGFEIVPEDLVAVGPAAIVTTVAVYR